MDALNNIQKDAVLKANAELTSLTTLTMVLTKKAGTPTVRNKLDSVQLITYMLESW